MNLPLILAAAGLLSCIACTSSAMNEPQPFRSLAKGGFSGFTDHKRLVITSQPDWKRQWTTLSARSTDAGQAPAVDFSREMVILVAMGERRTGGFDIEITKVETAGSKLRIHVRRREPSPGGFQLQAITSPFHAVAIKRVGLQPEFIEAPSENRQSK